MGRPIPPVMLQDGERETLEQWARRPKTAQALALRARIILGCADGQSNTAVADGLRISKPTVGKWRSRFLEQRLEGLLDEPRSGRPRTVADADVERVLALTLETTPHDATHWSTRSMARRCDLSQSAVSRIWRAFGLQPHRTETFKLSADSLHRESAGRRGAVSQPSGPGLGTLRGREVPDSGPGPYPSAAAHAAGTGRAAHPRLLSLWHDLAFRRAGRQNRQSDRSMPSASPGGGVPQVSGPDRGQCARRNGGASDSRQLGHSQDGDNPQVVRQAAPVPNTLHADQRLLVELGGALVCAAHGEAVAPGSASEHRGTGGCYLPVPGGYQRSPQAFCLDQDLR